MKELRKELDKNIIDCIIKNGRFAKIRFKRTDILCSLTGSVGKVDPLKRGLRQTKKGWYSMENEVFTTGKDWICGY
ncbi:MAG: hypothetical protein NC827_08400 [Candidatus Omnitrophica bacterium]|nr:hypothetical protein [Candidatus Omnitrophota bacterium]MCM8803310.1 hypothetical protein [Candidatus Omnitrophota bacterium]